MKSKKILFTIAFVLSLILISPISTEAASQLAKPKIAKVNLETATSAKITWKKVAKAKKYTVYYSQGAENTKF